MSELSRRGLLALGTAAAVTSGASAQEAPPMPAPMRARVLEILRARRVPGAGIAVVRDGRAVTAEGLGLASVPFAAPATARSLFHLGSVSKQFTAATVVALARQGRIRLDDPVGRHVKDLPPSLAERPVAALLSHTSGVPDYEGLPGFDADRAISRETFTKAVGQMPSDFAPGEAWAYSNSGYVLLGYLIADVTGGTYHQAVETRLLGGLQDARFDDATALIPGRAEPYVADGEALRHATQMDGDYSSWPDGGLLMSARDAVRWEAGLQAGAPIPPADFRAMTTPVRLATGRSAGYGFGWFTDRAHGRDLHYHSGSVPGFLSFYWRTPAERLGVLVMLNLESGGAAVAMRQIAQELAEAAAPGTTLLSLRPIGDGEAALTGQALSMVTRGGTPLDATLFAPEIVALLPRMAGRVGPPNRTALGAPASFELVEAFDEPGGHVRRYRAAFADRTEHYAFAHAADGRIFRVRTV